MKTKLILSPSELRDSVIDFYLNYNGELENYKNIINKQLHKLIKDYLKERNLPKGSVVIAARIKTVKSSLKKMKNKGWPQFNYFPEVITDLIGIRIICLFLDDCYRVMEQIKQSEYFEIINIENYIDEPKNSGYRAIHLNSFLLKDSLEFDIDGNELSLLPPFNFEIQIETKLQEAWSEISHEFYMQSKNKDIKDKSYQSFLEKSAERLFNEDKLLNKFKIIWETRIDNKINSN